MRQDIDAGSLQLEQDPRAQRLEWRFERAGWVTIGLVLVAALFGVLGDGPASRASARTTNGRASVAYDHVVRYGTSTSLTLSLPPDAARDTMATLSLDRAFLERADVDRVTPEPVETRGSASMIEYHFRRAAADAPLVVEFSVRGTSVGVRHAQLGTSFGTLAIRQFVLP